MPDDLGFMGSLELIGGVVSDDHPVTINLNFADLEIIDRIKAGLKSGYATDSYAVKMALMFWAAQNQEETNA